MSIAAVLRCGGGKFSRLLIFAAGKSAALSAAFISRHRGASGRRCVLFPATWRIHAHRRVKRNRRRIVGVAVDGGGFARQAQTPQTPPL